MILPLKPTANEVEKLEEAKLKAKFPAVGGRPISGHSAFLQKRLAKGVSVFNTFIQNKLILLSINYETSPDKYINHKNFDYTFLYCCNSQR